MRERLRLAVPMLAILAVSPFAARHPLKLPVGWTAQSEGSREAARERWQKVSEVFALMAVAPGGAVADVGAGSGFFTVRLADAVGAAGRVYAVDISEQVLRDLRERVERDGRGNVTVVAGETDDPCLPESSVDAVLINNAYHEMGAHDAMLDHLWSALRPGGRLVIVDQIDASRRDADRERQTARHEIGPGFVQADLEAAGFEVVATHDPFIERGGGDLWWLIVARRPPAGTPGAVGSDTDPGVGIARGRR